MTSRQTVPSWPAFPFGQAAKHILQGEVVNGQVARKRLALPPGFQAWWGMLLPTQPVTLTVEQLGELNGKLSAMRHDINNQLSLIIAAVELIRHKPELAERMMKTLAEQPARIADTLLKFSTEFERAFGISRR